MFFDRSYRCGIFTILITRSFTIYHSIGLDEFLSLNQTSCPRAMKGMHKGCLQPLRGHDCNGVKFLFYFFSFPRAHLHLCTSAAVGKKPGLRPTRNLLIYSNLKLQQVVWFLHTNRFNSSRIMFFFSRSLRRSKWNHRAQQFSGFILFFRRFLSFF